jgi:hypothetical protein
VLELAMFGQKHLLHLGEQTAANILNAFALVPPRSRQEQKVFAKIDRVHLFWLSLHFHVGVGKVVCDYLKFLTELAVSVYQLGGAGQVVRAEDSVVVPVKHLEDDLVAVSLL